MYVVLAAALLAGPPPSASLDIDFWYGAQQEFGTLGRPQEQINILGNVWSVEGLSSLSYALDGGPFLPLSFGPDMRRLVAPGDFNIELFLDDLAPGKHDIVVRAVDNTAAEVTESMSFYLAPPAVWPLPYTATWFSALDITSAAQPVDGLWIVGTQGVRCPAMGYDRLLAIGDTTWTNYEVTVTITIHAIDPNGYLPPSFTPGVGLILRWNGHSDFFKPGSQPSLGWWPLGAAVEYAYHVDQCGARLQMYGDPFVLRDQDDDCTPLEFDVPYHWKARVRTQSNGTHFYGLKVWPVGSPEPANWQLSMFESPAKPAHGCILLFAHHVDASYSDVTIVPLPPPTVAMEEARDPARSAEPRRGRR